MKLILALAAIVAASMSSQVHGAPALVSGLDRGIATSCDRDSFANHVTYNSPATRTTIKCTNTFAPGGGLPMSWGVESAVAVATEVDDFHCPQDMLISEMTCEKASCSVPTIQCQQAVRVVDAGMDVAGGHESAVEHMSHNLTHTHLDL